LMPTTGERRVLLFLGATLTLGSGARTIGAVAHNDGVPASAKAALERQISVVDSARKKGRRSKPKKPKPLETAAPAIIDLDVATAEEIETIRGIGPSLAKRIVADRDSLGPFGSLDELQRVKGVGPKLARNVAPSVTFSLLPRPSTTANTRSKAPKRRKPPRGDSEN
ncbi:MAG TPA: helix-hairpin-helix domain-containing protein, partial [Gemmatimonadaceae bacterium]